MKRLTLESAARNEHFSDELKLTFVAVVVGLLLAVAGNRLDDVIKWFFATSTPIPARDLATAAVCSLLAFFIGWRFGIKNFRERFLRSKAIISPLDTARAYRAVVLTLSRAFETTRDGNPSQLEMAERAIADIKRKLGGAEAKVVEMKGKAEGDGYALQVQAAGGAADYNALQFAKQLSEKIRLFLIYAGPGTLWTDVEKATGIAPLELLKQIKQPDTPKK